MSSLLQHHGGRSADGRKVELLCYLDDSDPIELTRLDGTKSTCSQLYRFYRAPRGMFGPWVVFQYNGAEHVPDLSVPIALHKLPRDAKPLTREECAQYWFNS